jgi:hypothetical protein
LVRALPPIGWTRDFEHEISSSSLLKKKEIKYNAMNVSKLGLKKRRKCFRKKKAKKNVRMR